MSEIVIVSVDGEALSVERGASIAAVAAEVATGDKQPALGAIAYGKVVGLDCRLGMPTDVRLLTMGSREGDLIYRRTLSLMLYSAFQQLRPGAQVAIGQSLAHGYFYTVAGAELDDELIASLEARLHEFVERDEPIVKETMPVEEAMEYFAGAGYYDKVALLRARRKSHIGTVRLGDFRDIQHGPMAPSCAPICHFGLVSYPPGLVLQFDVRRSAKGAQLDVPEQTKLFQTYRETREWNEILRVENVGRLNALAINGHVPNIIRVAEGFQEKKVAAVADAIAARLPDLRLVLIAGPSSSGKTTFSARLSVQLRVLGIQPVALSMDNWYRNRVDTPLDPETGEYDFECLDALDLQLFNDNVSALLRGEEVRTPIYDFHAGTRVPEERWPAMGLKKDQVLIAEGIHGLNERLSSAVAARNKYKIYVSALTQLCLDDHNRIFTSDARLLRRTVRDARYRGYDAETTLLRWPSVRAGERKWIFPFQEEADVMFNSALVYEVSVLKVLAEHYLLAVAPSSPAYPEAYRLMKFLEHFVPIPGDAVPRASILREFIGGSVFRSAH